MSLVQFLFIVKYRAISEQSRMAKNLHVFLKINGLTRPNKIITNLDLEIPQKLTTTAFNQHTLGLKSAQISQEWLVNPAFC